MKPGRQLPPFDAPTAVMKIAGAWLARRDRGFTAAEQAEFDRWRQADTSHGAAIAQLEHTLCTFDRLRELAPQYARTPDRDAFAPARAVRRIRAASLLAGMAATLTLLFWFLRPPPDQAWHHATAPDGYHRTTLPDGSIIELNGGTAIDIQYTSRDRRIRLARGEAHFQVAKDPSRPFTVQADTVAVSAIGTAFNIRLADTRVEVLVTAGRVRVEPPEPRAGPAEQLPGSPAPPPPPALPVLTAGHRIVVPTAAEAEPGQIAAVTTEEIQQALAWQLRVAQFSRTPLGMAVAEFNRQNSRPILIMDPGLASLQIGGSFRTDQPDAFVRLLETSMGVKATREGDRIILRPARDKLP